MKLFPALSRRRFLSTAASTAAYSLVAHRRAAAALLNSPNQAASAEPSGKWMDEGVIDLSNSPHARLKTVPVRSVTIRDGFWLPRRKTNVEASIPSMRDELVNHGRMNNFLRLEKKTDAPQQGPVYSDSDIYKWMEAVGFALQSEPQPALRSTTEGMIQAVVAAQEPSGYLNTYYVGDHAPQRMLPALQHRTSAARRDCILPRDG
jgi:hypothetical protein